MGRIVERVGVKRVMTFGKGFRGLALFEEHVGEHTPGVNVTRYLAYDSTQVRFRLFEPTQSPR